MYACIYVYIHEINKSCHPYLMILIFSVSYNTCMRYDIYLSKKKKKRYDMILDTMKNKIKIFFLTRIIILIAYNIL